MSITGFLSDFSLTEIFDFIQQGRKTCRLTVCAIPTTAETSPTCYYIWVKDGNIVSAANRLDHQGLITIIAQQHWVNYHVLAKLVQFCCPKDKPLGLCLKSHCVLQHEDLKQLFSAQILPALHGLFKLKDGHFTLEQNTPLPNREMTGLSLPIASIRSICYRSCNSPFSKALEISPLSKIGLKLTFKKESKLKQKISLT
ncbi:MAG TPA: hypothetical protein DD379_26985 [Cyanobacteria bacterium UBA11162]|nr:hypothetical protein [Cyanobacteria bacterium UBA11162]